MKISEKEEKKKKSWTLRKGEQYFIWISYCYYIYILINYSLIYIYYQRSLNVNM